MKKIFAVLAGAALMLTATDAFAQISVGAGWINSTERATYKDNTPEKANLNGFYAGGQYNIPIVGGLSVAPGLYASMLFGKETASGLVSTETKYSELAINVPVNVAYTFTVGDFKVFGYAGPIFQYGLMSKSVGKLSVPGLSTGDITTDLYTGKISDKDGNSVNGDPSRAPFNVYIGGGAGIQAGNFQVILGYDHSLTNITKVADTKLSRSEIKIGVGYAF